ncbi:MAG TPA: DUF6569 family protein [Chryseolinea sp.]|nr:DUF6569 family protein [Chryseolinea sp.]
MKTTKILCILLLGCASQLYAQYNKDNLMLESSAVANSYRFKNLQLYPIRANKTFETAHKDVGRYSTLKEAMQEKKIAVTEHARGDVNTLFVENISSDTIMILAGEVVQGGKQDRMVAEDFILYPKSGKKDLSVFCVEHGRWQAKQSGGAFNNYFSISSNEVRKAGSVKKSQQEVWDKVAENTQKNNANTTTGTLAALHDSESLKVQLKQYADFFGERIVNEGDIVGVIAVSGDAILGCDMFATHDIFQKHYNNLIQSYATEAITFGKSVNIPYQTVTDYLQSIIGDETKQEEKVKENGVLLKDGKRKVHISTF